MPNKILLFTAKKKLEVVVKFELLIKIKLLVLK